MTTLTEKIARALYEWDVAALDRHQDERGVTRTSTPWELLNATRRASYLARAEATLAIVRAHLTDEDTVERAARAHFMSHYASPDIYPLLSEPAKDMWKSDCRAALAAALDQEEQK